MTAIDALVHDTSQLPRLTPSEAAPRPGCGGGCGSTCPVADCSICEGLTWCHRCERRRAPRDQWSTFTREEAR